MTEPQFNRIGRRQWIEYLMRKAVEVERVRLAQLVRELPSTTVTTSRWDSNGVLWIDDASLGTGTEMIARADVLAMLEER